MPGPTTPPPGPELLPHPATGELFSSPVPPGSGWPGEPSAPGTPVAHDADQVRALAAAAGGAREVVARSCVCRACPRLVAWREEVARTRRRAYRQEPYWGRPVPSLGVDTPSALVVGLAPAAHGGNRTGRMFTGDRSGDWIVAALHRAGLATRATSVHAADGLELVGTRIVAPVRCAPPDNKPTTGERDTCAGWLDAELAALTGHVRAVLALGAFAWASSLTAARRAGWSVPRPQPRFGHGAEAVLTCPDGPVHLLGSYHVSRQNTATGRLTEPMLDAVVSRLAQLSGAAGT
ncbi:uracil-DNA glycosylase [Kineococcus sp. G2]|uniref:uracil-DNA glycosylase n=1 Tax=Kineococcus sp. G2 TaxID=3127484 RepID=UPI00301C04FB